MAVTTTSTARAKPPDFEAEAGIVGTVSSNPFHIQADRLSSLEDKVDPGDRFFEIVGPTDFITTALGAVGIEQRVAHKTRARIELAGAYNRFARNPIFSFAELGARLSLARSKRYEIGLEADWVPRRLRRNYRQELEGGQSTFSHAYQSDLGVAADFERRWFRSWTTDVEVSWVRRRFEAPFELRDRTTLGIGLKSLHRLAKPVELELGVEGKRAHVDLVEELGLDRDRSWMSGEAHVGVDVDVLGPLRVGAEVSQRIKSYTTPVVIDRSRYQRDDYRTEVAIDARLRLDHVTIELEGEHTINNVDRVDASPTDDGYREWVASLGVYARM